MKGEGFEHHSGFFLLLFIYWGEGGIVEEAFK